MQDDKVFPNLEVLKVHLSATFQPPKSEFRTRQRFLAIKQGKRSLHDYVQEVRMLVSDITEDPVDQATQVSVFLGGLQSGPVRTQLFRAYPHKLEDAINLALQEDFSYRQSNANAGVYLRDARPPRLGNGPTPMDIGMVQQMNQGSQKAIRCFRCNAVGHMKNQCPKNSGNNGRKPNAMRSYGPNRPQKGRPGPQAKNENRQ
jgi:hypothetical protein